MKGGDEARRTRVVQLCHRIIFFLVFVCAVCPRVALSKPTDCGTHGDTWGVQEADPADEINAAYETKKDQIAAQISAVQIKDYEPQTKAIVLQRAIRKHSFLIDTTYTLDNDIKDNVGNVIYPAGTKYNILDYPPFPLRKKYVVFNGETPAEVEYVIKNFGDDPTVTYITGGGMKGWQAARGKIGTGVKILTEDLAKVLHLSKSVSVVSQDGRSIKVDEIPIPVSTENTNNREKEIKR